MSANEQDQNAPQQRMWNANTPRGGGQGGQGRARSGGQRGSRGGGKFSGGDRGGRNAGGGGGARSRAGLLNIDCANIPSSYENPWGYSQGSGSQQQGGGNSEDMGQDCKEPTRIRSQGRTCDRLGGKGMHDGQACVSACKCSVAPSCCTE